MNSEYYSSLKIHLCRLAELIQPTHFLTLRFHNRQPFTLSKGRRALRKFIAQVDARLMGRRRYSELSGLDQSFFLAIPEGEVSSRSDALCRLHYNLLLLPPPDPQLRLDHRQFATMLRSFWAEVVPSGDAGTEAIHDASELCSYVSKAIADSTSPVLNHYELRLMSD